MNQRSFELDIARFFAAFLVVLYHYVGRSDSESFIVLYPIAKFGWLGVPFFFILSGYVIAYSAENKSGVRFAIDRFVRLFPTLWICIFITSVVWLFSSYPNKTIDIPIFISSFTLLNSIFNLPYVDGVYWTLFEEIKFYFFIWLLVALGVFVRVKIWLSVWLCLVTLHVFFYEIPYFTKFVNPMYSSFFIAGIAFYFSSRPAYQLWSTLVLSITYIVSIKTIGSVIPNYMKSSGSQDLLICMILILTFYIFFNHINGRRIEFRYKKLCILLGGMSYPLYLIHNIAGKSIIHTLSNIMNPNIVVILVIILSLVASAFIHVFFERRTLPILKSRLIAVLSFKRI